MKGEAFKTYRARIEFQTEFCTVTINNFPYEIVTNFPDNLWFQFCLLIFKLYERGCLEM